MEDWWSESEQATLRSLRMAVIGGAMADGELVLDIQFENTSSTSFVLAGDLGGEDFLLREVGGAIHGPLRYSDRLRLLDDGSGLEPGERVFGTVTFPAPDRELFELHFREFAPIRMNAKAFGSQARATASRSDAPASVASVSRTEPVAVEGLGARALPGGTVGGVGTVTSPTVALPSVPSPTEELVALLERQSTAIERYDIEGYLETFVPALRAQEHDIFRRLRDLPLARLQQTLLGAPRPAASGREDAVGHQVELSYWLEGLGEDNPWVHTLEVRFEREAGAWRVASIVDPGSRPVAWRGGALVVQRSHHFLLTTHPDLRHELVDLAADAEAGYAALLAQGFPLAEGYFVTLVADPEEYRALTGRGTSLGVALARYVSQADGTTTVDSRGFYINGSLFANRGRSRAVAEMRHVTVTHELVHLALAGDTRVFTPVWLKEGLAVLFSGDRSTEALRRLVGRGLEHLDLVGMTGARSLGEHDAVGQQTADEYLYVGQVAAFLVERRGQEALLALYRAFAGVTPGDLARLALQDPEVSAAVIRAGVGRHAERLDPATTVDLAMVLARPVTEELLTEHYALRIGELDTAVKDWLRQRHPA